MIKYIAVAIVLTLAPAVFAQTYIVPEGDCGAVTFHTTRGTDFPNLGERITADRVKDAHVFLPKQRVAVKPAADSLDFNTKVAAADGVVMAAIDFKPEIIGNETRTEHAKAFVYCGTKTPAFDWQRETGLGLEIFPQWNGAILRMKPGDSMHFIVVHQRNNWLRDLPMELYRAGAGHVATGTPDKIGGMDFPYEKGRYMVTTTYRRPDPQQPQLWLVDTSTVTFEIK